MKVNGPVGSPPAGDIAPLRLPDPEKSFRARAERLAALAREHPAAPFLELLARIARAQDRAVREVRVAAGAQVTGGRPLDRARVKREPAWLDALRIVVRGSREGPLPDPAREALARLELAGVPELESLADEILADGSRDLAAAPFVGAALQAYFEPLAAGLDPAAVTPAAGGACPVCGSPPVAGVVLGDERLRYLACALCGSRWHLPRIQCASCGDGAAISYFSIESAPSGAKAETCGACKTYLKLFDLLDDPRAEPVADDAATLVLDILMGEQGYRRAGVNLLAPGGEPADPS